MVFILRLLVHSVAFGGNHYRYLVVSQAGNNGVGLVDFIGHYRLAVKVFQRDQGLSSTVGSPPRREHYLWGVTQGVNESVNLSSQPAPAASEGLSRGGAFFGWSPVDGLSRWWSRSLSSLRACLGPIDG